MERVGGFASATYVRLSLPSWCLPDFFEPGAMGSYKSGVEVDATGVAISEIAGADRPITERKEASVDNLKAQTM